MTQRYNTTHFKRQKSRALCCWTDCQNPKHGVGCVTCFTDSQIGLKFSYCQEHANHAHHFGHIERDGMWVDILSRSALLRDALGIGNATANVREMALRLHRVNLSPRTFIQNRGNFDRLCDDVLLASCV